MVNFFVGMLVGLIFGIFGCVIVAVLSAGIVIDDSNKLVYRRILHGSWMGY